MKQKIILIRHGKPRIPSLNKLCPLMFSNWVNSYNTSGLCPDSPPTDEAIKIAHKCNAIVCSELPRSMESAKALKLDKITLSSSVFNEAGLPVSSWRFPRLSPKVWAVFFRILWLFGYSQNSESFKEAKTRAEEAANQLKMLADNDSPVLFVGHGVFNRLVANELNATGWSGPKNPSTKYWSYGVYKK